VSEVAVDRFGAFFCQRDREFATSEPEFIERNSSAGQNIEKEFATEITPTSPAAVNFMHLAAVGMNLTQA